MQKIYLFAIICFLLAGTRVNAQAVGIGTTTPNKSAILDLTSPNRGILIQRMDSATRRSIKSPADGLMVYDNNYQIFYYFKGGYDWIPMGFIPTPIDTTTVPKIAFNATLGGSRNLANNAFVSPTTFVESYDFSDNFNNNTGIFTAPDTAVYHFNISIDATLSNGGNTVFVLQCQKNGSPASAGTKTQVVPAAPAGSNATVSTSLDIQLNKADTFSFKFMQRSSTATLVMYGGTASNISTVISGFKVL